jgi:Protein of unknown function (DUF3455)
MLKKFVLLCLLFPAIACAQTEIPEAIQVPEGHNRILSLHAKGDQIYQCVSQKGEFSWQLLKPNAMLFDASGQLVGSHTAGPEWKYKDGSQIKGRLDKKTDVTPDSAIAWLLLEATEPQGNGILTKARFIQRVNTRGGLPPTSDCNNNHLGIEKMAAYSADYIFYAEK